MATYHPDQIRNLAGQLSATANTLNHQFSSILQSIKLSATTSPHSNTSSRDISQFDPQSPQALHLAHKSYSTPHAPGQSFPPHHHDLDKYTEQDDDEELLQDIDLTSLSQHIAKNPTLFDPRNNRPPQLSDDGRLIKLDESTEHRTHQLKKDIELLLSTIQHSLVQQGLSGADSASKTTHQPQHRETLHNLLHMLSIMYTVDDATYHRHYEPICQYFHDFLFHPNSTRLVPSKYPQTGPGGTPQTGQHFTFPSTSNLPHQVSQQNAPNNPPTDPSNPALSSFFDLPAKVKNVTNSPNPDPRQLPSARPSHPTHPSHPDIAASSPQTTPTNNVTNPAFQTPTVHKNLKRHSFDDSTPTSQSQQLKHQNKGNKQGSDAIVPDYATLTPHNQIVRSNRRTQLGDNELEAMFDQNPDKLEKNTKFGVISTRNRKNRQKARLNNKNDESTDAHSKYDSDDQGAKQTTQQNPTQQPTQTPTSAQRGGNKIVGAHKASQSNRLKDDFTDSELEDFYSSDESEVELAFSQIEHNNFPTPTPKQYHIDPRYKERLVQREIVEEKENAKSGKKGYVTQFIPSIRNRDPQLLNDPDIVIEGNIDLNEKSYAADLDDLSSSSSPWDEDAVKAHRRHHDNDGFKLNNPPNAKNPIHQNTSPNIKQENTPGRGRSNTFQTTPIVSSTSQHNVPNGIEFINGRWTKVKSNQSSANQTQQNDGSSGFLSDDDDDDDDDENALDDIPDFDTPAYTDQTSPQLNHLSSPNSPPSSNFHSAQSPSRPQLRQVPSSDRVQAQQNLGKLMQTDPVTGKSYSERTRAIKQRVEKRLPLSTVDKKTLAKFIQDGASPLDDGDDQHTAHSQNSGGKKQSPSEGNSTAVISPTPATITFKGASTVEHGDSDVPATPLFTSHGTFFTNSPDGHNIDLEQHNHLAELAGLQIDAIGERSIVNPANLAGADVLDGLSTASSTGTGSTGRNTYPARGRAGNAATTQRIDDEDDDMFAFEDFQPADKKGRTDKQPHVDFSLDDMSDDEDGGTKGGRSNTTKRPQRTLSATPTKGFIQGIPQDNGGLANYQGFTKPSPSSSSLSNSSLPMSLNSLTNHHTDKGIPKTQPTSGGKSSRPVRDKSKTRTVSLDLDELDDFGDSDDEGKKGLARLKSKAASNPQKQTAVPPVKEDNPAKKELNELLLPDELKQAFLVTEQQHHDFFFGGSRR